MRIEAELEVNGAVHGVEAEESTPLLYIIRNDLKLKGTRYGCGAGHCGACTVIMEGRAVRSCDIPLWAAQRKAITTIEGLSTPASAHPLLQAFVDEQAMQCGYCVNGIIMTAAALLAQKPDATEQEIALALDDNLCRCGVHGRMLRAIRRAGALLRKNADGTADVAQRSSR